MPNLASPDEKSPPLDEEAADEKLRIERFLASVMPAFEMALALDRADDLPPAIAVLVKQLDAGSLGASTKATSRRAKLKRAHSRREQASSVS